MLGYRQQQTGSSGTFRKREKPPEWVTEPSAGTDVVPGPNETARLLPDRKLSKAKVFFYALRADDPLWHGLPSQPKGGQSLC